MNYTFFLEKDIDFPEHSLNGFCMLQYGNFDISFTALYRPASSLRMNYQYSASKKISKYLNMNIHIATKFQIKKFLFNLFLNCYNINGKDNISLDRENIFQTNYINQYLNSAYLPPRQIQLGASISL